MSYAQFLVPGLVMMSVLQNAFANSSSSLIQSKITGNLVFMLLPPISYLEFFCAYVLASMVRGLVVGAGVLAVTVWFVDLRIAAPLWVFAFALLGVGDSRRARPDRGHLGRQVRPDRRVPELRHPAADVSFRACSTRSSRCPPCGRRHRT